jgi:serine/threonine protein kinase
VGDLGFTCEGFSLSSRESVQARGTEDYYAPELLKFDKRTFTNRVDIWGLGCIVYEIATGHKAFNSFDIMSYSRSGVFTRAGFPFHEATFDLIFDRLITRMLAIDPQSRPNIALVLQTLQQCIQDQVACDEVRVAKGIWWPARDEEKLVHKKFLGESVPGETHAVENPTESNSR